MGYVQYIGANPYSQAVTAGNTTQDVQAAPGQTLSLAPALSSWLTTNLPSVWIPVPGFPVPQMTVTSAYMATAANGVIFADASGGGFPIYLANAAAARSSAITIKNSGTANTVTLSGQFVDDQSSVALAVDQLVTIESDGSAWRMVGSSPQLPISGGSGGSPAAVMVGLNLNFGPLSSNPPTVMVPLIPGSQAVQATVLSSPKLRSGGGVVVAGMFGSDPPSSGTLTIEYLEMLITNMDGTEAILVEGPTAPFDFPNGNITDFSSAGGHVGTDLSSDGAGVISSAAGGVFIVQGAIYLTWTP